MSGLSTQFKKKKPQAFKTFVCFEKEKKCIFTELENGNANILFML